MAEPFVVGMATPWRRRGCSASLEKERKAVAAALDFSHLRHSGLPWKRAADATGPAAADQWDSTRVLLERERGARRRRHRCMRLILTPGGGTCGPLSAAAAVSGRMSAAVRAPGTQLGNNGLRR